MKAILTDEEVAEIVAALQCCKIKNAPDLITKLQNKVKSTPLMDRIRELAQQEGEEGRLEFDEDCTVSIEDRPGVVPEGAYVQGWFWIPNPELDEDPKPFTLPLGCEVRGFIRTTYSSDRKTTAILLKLHWPAGDEPEQDEEHPLSVNIVEPCGGTPSNQLEDGEFYVKNWGGNEDFYKALIEKGLIEQVDFKFVRTGHVEAPCCKLTDKGEKWVEELVQK